MKHIFAVIALLAVPFAGCHAGGQQPPTPPQSSCQPAGSYTAINPVGSTTNPPTTSTTLTVSSVTTETCYLAQGYLPPANGVQGQYGAVTNIVGPTIGGATGKVELSVSCTAAAGQTCTGVLWVFSSSQAVTALAPGVPTMSAPTTSKVEKSASPSNPETASVSLGAHLSAASR